MIRTKLIVIAGALMLGACASTQTAGKSAYNGSILTQAEIDASAGRTIGDVIKQLRPLFLQPQGPTSPNAPPLLVYLDERYFGDVSSLQTIQSFQVSQVRYYRPTESGIKFGTNASGGVIALTSRK
jgi:hypothetical protein